jgi:hypothetical protein
MITTDTPHHDLGADYYTRRINPDRRRRHLTAQLEQLSYTVTLTPTPPGRRQPAPPEHPLRHCRLPTPKESSVQRRPSRRTVAQTDSETDLVWPYMPGSYTRREW